MRLYPIVLLFLSLSLVFSTGCVESSAPPTNSERGYLYVDLDAPLAVGWTSEIYVLGPATGGRHCEPDVGCFPDHYALDEITVTVSDESIVEVLSVEVEPMAGVSTVRITLQALEPGDAQVDLAFLVPDRPEVEDEERDDEGRLFDSFQLETREVAHLRLLRYLEGRNLTGPYRDCPEHGAGTYLMEYLDAYQVLLRFRKLDSRGHRLRGSGDFPLTVDPEDALTIADYQESQDLIRVRPTEFGPVTLSPASDNDEVTLIFRRPGVVQALQAQGFGLDHQGNRGLEVGEFRSDHLYELQVSPSGLEAPLCAGNIPTVVQPLTPAVCDILGPIESRDTLMIAAYVAGDCVLRLHAPAARGRAGVTQDLLIPVLHGFE